MPDFAPPDDPQLRALNILASEGDQWAIQKLAEHRQAAVNANLGARQAQARREGRRFHPAEAELAVSQAQAATPATFLDTAETAGDVQASIEEGQGRGVVGGVAGNATRTDLNLIRAFPGLATTEDITPHDVQAHAAKRAGMEEVAAANQGFTAKAGSFAMDVGKLAALRSPAMAGGMLGLDIGIPTAIQTAEAAQAEGDTNVGAVAAEAAAVAAGRGGAMFGGMHLGSAALGRVLPAPAVRQVGGRSVSTLPGVAKQAAYGVAEAVPQNLGMLALGAPVEALAPEGVGTSLEDQLSALPASAGEFAGMNAFFRGAPAIRGVANARAIRRAGVRRAGEVPTDAREAYRSMQAEYPVVPGLRRPDAPAALVEARGRAEANRQAALAEVPEPAAVREPAAGPLPEPNLEGRMDPVRGEINDMLAREGYREEGALDLPSEPVGEPAIPDVAPLAKRRLRRMTPGQAINLEATKRRDAEMRAEAERRVLAERNAEAQIAGSEAERQLRTENRAGEIDARLAELEATRKTTPTPPVEKVDEAAIADEIATRVRDRYAASRMNVLDPDIGKFPIVGNFEVQRLQRLAQGSGVDADNARAYLRVREAFAKEHGGNLTDLHRYHSAIRGKLRDALVAGRKFHTFGVPETAQVFADVSRIPSEVRGEHKQRAEERTRQSFAEAVSAEHARRQAEEKNRIERKALLREQRGMAKEAARGKAAEAATAVEALAGKPEPIAARIEPVEPPAKVGEAAPVEAPPRTGEAAPAPAPAEGDNHILAERAREAAARKRASVAEAISKGHDVARAEADAEFERTKAATATAKERIAVKEATAADRKAAQAAGQEHVDVADKRLKLAEARLAEAQGTGDGEAIAKAAREHATAKADHAEAVADFKEIQTNTRESKATLAKAKADEGKAKVEAEKATQRAEADRLRPHMEKAARETLGEDVRAETTEDGNIAIKHKDGAELFKIVPHRKALPPEEVDTAGWWESAKENKDLKARIRKLVKGEMPVTAEEIDARISPKDLLALKKEFPVLGGYRASDRSVHLYGTDGFAADSRKIDAVAVGRHEANHWLVHGMMGAALRNPEIAKHLDTLIKVTGIDPKTAGFRPFVEEVYRRYAEWYKRAGVRATGASLDKVRGENLVSKAFRVIADFFRRMRKTSADPKVKELSFDDVAKAMKDGTFTLEATGPVEPVAGEPYAVGRRPLRDGEEDPNLSFNRLSEKERGIAEAVRAKFAKRQREVSWDEQERLADAEIEKAGGKTKAVESVLARLEGAAERGDVLSESHVDQIIIQRAIQKEIQKYTEGGVFHPDKIERLVLADLNIGEEAGRQLQARRDRLDTPEQRLASVYRTFYEPSPSMRKAMAEAKRAIGKAKTRGDEAAQRVAAEKFDRLVERHRKAVQRRTEQMKEVGVDITDAKSLHEWLNDEAYGVVMDNIRALQDYITPKSIPDWVIDNYRAHLLGNPLVTQTQQLASNTLSALSNTVYNMQNPNVIRAVMTRDVARAVALNFKESFAAGKNAWVHKLTGSELGRVEDEKHLPARDWYSKVNQALSFNIMAAIDGAAQRYNAALEGARLSYEQARAKGADPSEALNIARHDSANLSGPIAVEAMFRSLPHTFQELSMRRPGEKPEPLDRLVGNVSRTIADFTDRMSLGWTNEKTGEVIGFEDPATGLPAKLAVSKIVLPFVRTTMAIARAATRHSVLGVGEAAYELRKSIVEADPEAKALSKEAMKRRIYESIVIGAVGMHLLAWALDAEGTDVEDKQAAYTGRAKGEKTISLFGRRIGYSRLEPFATPLAMAANGINALRRGENPVTSELAAVVKMGADLAWFRLISDIGGTAQEFKRDSDKGVERVGAGLSKWGQRTGIAMLPGIGHAGVRAVLKNEGDEMTRPSKDASVAAQEVGLADKVPVVDVWGRQVKRGPMVGDGVIPGAEKAIGGAMGRSAFYNPTDVDTWAEEKGIKIRGFNPRYPKGHENAEKPMSDKDTAEFEQIAGPLYLERMRAFMESNRDADKERIEKGMERIKGIINHRAMVEWKARRSPR